MCLKGWGFSGMLYWHFDRRNNLRNLAPRASSSYKGCSFPQVSLPLQVDNPNSKPAMLPRLPPAGQEGKLLKRGRISLVRS